MEITKEVVLGNRVPEEVNEKQEDTFDPETQSGVKSKNVNFQTALQSISQGVRGLKQELSMMSDAKYCTKVELLSVTFHHSNLEEKADDETSNLVEKLNMEIASLKQEIEKTNAVKAKLLEAESRVLCLEGMLEPKEMTMESQARQLEESKKQLEFLRNENKELKMKALKPSFRVYCKENTRLSLAIRDGRVILARSDPDDLFQHWIKDNKYSAKVKDKHGFPSFALVNKATGEAMKHSICAAEPVQLTPYKPNDVIDNSILWSEASDLGDGYRAIRMTNKPELNLDAFKGSDSIRDGTIVGLWEWIGADNQRWKIISY